jgi:hypothetical protein
VGTAILVDRTSAPLVKDNNILIEGRAQFITLHLPDSSLLTIINIYAPTSSRNRAPLWRRVSAAEFVADHIILGGDFNHLEEVSRRGLAGERWMHKREAASWHHMTLQYGLADVWTMDNYRKMSKKDYTFDNGRSGPGSAVSRIDKFLVTQELDSRGGRIEVAPSIKKMLDHSPLVMTIWGQAVAPHNATFYFDISLLEEEESRASLLMAWKGASPLPNRDADWPAWLKAAIDKVARCCASLSKRLKSELKGLASEHFSKKI